MQIVDKDRYKIKQCHSFVLVALLHHIWGIVLNAFKFLLSESIVLQILDIFQYVLSTSWVLVSTDNHDDDDEYHRERASGVDIGYDQTTKI